MAKAALEQLAERTDEPVERLKEWRERGLIRGNEGESVADAERVRLVRFLHERGFDLDLITRVDTEHGGLLDRFVESAYAWGPLPEHSLSDLADRSDNPDLARRLWEAASFSEREDGVGEDDLRALTALAAAVDAGLPEDALFQLVRVYSDALRRVAEAEVRLFHFYVHERLRAEGLPPAELIEATEEVGHRLLGMLEPTVLYFHRKGWVSANRDDLALHVAQASEDAALPGVPGQLMAAVVFTDLARFTPLTDAMGDAAAADVVQRFSTIVRAATTACRGRVVKQIGDEFMLIFLEPRAALECAIRIDADASNESHFPAVRSGAHWGEMLYREGDWVGATVNIAARLAAQANAHELVVTTALASATGPLPDGVRATQLGPRSLKGLSEDLDLCVIRSGGAEEGGRVIDPVCGMEMPADHAAARLELAGELYSFCSNDCLQRFVAAPERYQ